MPRSMIVMGPTCHLLRALLCANAGFRLIAWQDGQNKHQDGHYKRDQAMHSCEAKRFTSAFLLCLSLMAKPI